MSRFLPATAAILSAVILVCAAASAAEAQTFCVQSSSRNLYLPSSGLSCARGEQSVTMATTADVDALKARVTALEASNTELRTRLAGVSRSGSTLLFTGMNLQLVNGLGSTQTINGLGNLIVGYNGVRSPLAPRARTGSHNLVVGEDHGYTSFGGIVGGFGNVISGQFATVTGGVHGVASGDVSSVSGGADNIASGEGSSVSGGVANEARGMAASVLGGFENVAGGRDASVLGGVDVSLSADDATYPAGP